MGGLNRAKRGSPRTASPAAPSLASNTCGLTPAGAADCWGGNSYLQALDRPGPYTQFATGGSHTCGLTPAGAADCWGDNFYGQAADQPGPYTHLAAGPDHTCALTPAGAAECWGSNQSGQAADQPGPYTQLAAGLFYTCGLTADGAADCWGDNGIAQVADQPGPYTQLAAGFGHTCGLTPAGAADCWGLDQYGQAADQPGPFGLSIDGDGDGVADSVDVCPGTVLAGDADRPAQLKANRYFADAAGIFIDAKGTDSGFTVAETGGCSAAQIIAAAGLGSGHTRFGITRSALQDWIATLA